MMTAALPIRDDVVNTINTDKKVQLIIFKINFEEDVSKFIIGCFFYLYQHNYVYTNFINSIISKRAVGRRCNKLH